MDVKKKKVSLAVVVIAFVTMLTSFIFDHIPATRTKGFDDLFAQNTWITLVFNTIALVCALVYLLKNGEKKAARFHKGFTGALLLMYISYFHLTLGAAMHYTLDKQALLHLYIFNLLLGFSAILLLTFAQNQGKKLSLFFAAIAVVAELVIFFFIVLNGISISVLFSFITKLLMINLLYSMVEYKYEDKEARGTV